MRLTSFVTALLLLCGSAPGNAQAPVPKEAPATVAPSDLTGTGCLLHGVPSRVIEACSRVLGAEPKHVEALALRAHAYRGNQNAPAAREDIRATLELDKENPRALALRVTMAQSSNSAEATATLQRDVDLINAIAGSSAAHFEARGVAKAARREYPAAIAIYTAGLEAHPDNAALLKARAATKATIGQHEAAVADMNQALAAAPADMNAYVSRGSYYYQMRRYPEALIDFNRALEMDLARGDVRMERARVYTAQKRYDIALADLDRVITENPGLGGAYFYRSQVHIDRNDLDKAIADLNVAIAVNPRSVVSYTRRASVHKRKGDTAAAFADYDKAVQIDGNSVDARVARAGARAEAGDHDKALADADEAVRLGPHMPIAHSVRAYALLQKGDHQGCVNAATKAIELGSKSPNDFGYRSQAHRRLGRLDLAIEDANKEIELAPDGARGYENRAALYTALGDTQKANGDRVRVESLKPRPATSPSAAVTAPAVASNKAPAVPLPGGSGPRTTDLARSQLDRREYDLAIAELDRVLVTEPRNYDGHIMRAEAYLGKRDLPRALADATKAIDINSGLFIGHALRCELNLVAKKFDAALADCNRAITIGPATPNTYASRGATYTQLKNYPAALTDLDKSLSMRETTYARFNRGIAHFYMKALDTAAEDFRKVLAENPNHQGAVLGLRMLTNTEKPGSHPMEVRVVRNADPRCGDQCAEWISAEGDIDAASADKFKAVFRQIGERKLPVFINSAGGRITSSLDIGRMIRARGLDVYVTRTEITDCKGAADVCRAAKSKGATFGVPRGKLASCASACTNILAAGTQRSVGASALVGVHQAAYYTVQDGKRTQSDKEIPQETYVKLKDYFVEMGVDAVVMLRMLNTPHKDMYWFRREELAQTRLTTQAKSGEELITGSETDDWMSVSKTAAAAITKANLDSGGDKSDSKPEAPKSEQRPAVIPPAIPPAPSTPTRPSQQPTAPPAAKAAVPTTTAACIGNRVTYTSFNDCVGRQQHPTYCSRICR